MTPFQSELCWEAQLERMLDDRKPEDAHLDYKGTESLLPSGRGGGGLDRQKRAEDISKDVSSFLNSDSGLMVYGVPESEDPSRTGGSPIPGGPEIGFRRGEVTKETIEDLITSNIQPRPGPDLFHLPDSERATDEPETPASPARTPTTPGSGDAPTATVAPRPTATTAPPAASRLRRNGPGSPGCHLQRNGRWWGLECTLHSLSDAPLSEWSGVKTDDDGRVIELEIRYSELTGEIPAELGSLSNLRTLQLSHNGLSGEIPAELGSLSNLRTLQLSHNGLSGEIPAELGSLSNLRTLQLSNNELSGEIPAKLGSLSNLGLLSLLSNDLSGEIPPELGSLSNLRRLRLYGNELSGEIPAELGSLSNLKWLQLSNNDLSGEIPAELGIYADLNWLHLDGNDLSGCVPRDPVYLHSSSRLGGLPFC